MKYTDEYVEGLKASIVIAETRAEAAERRADELVARERELRDLVSRQNVAMCCAMVASFGDPTPVVEILNNASMTTPEDFEGCNEDDIDRIHRLDLSYSGITVKADAIERWES